MLLLVLLDGDMNHLMEVDPLQDDLVVFVLEEPYFVVHYGERRQELIVLDVVEPDEVVDVDFELVGLTDLDHAALAGVLVTVVESVRLVLMMRVVVFIVVRRMLVIFVVRSDRFINLNRHVLFGLEPALLDVDEDTVTVVVDDGLLPLPVLQLGIVKCVDGARKALERLLVDVFVDLVKDSVDNSNLVGNLQLVEVSFVIKNVLFRMFCILESHGVEELLPVDLVYRREVLLRLDPDEKVAHL